MKIITGLGNPGSKYELNRHNLGYIILDYFAAIHKLTFKPGKGEFYYAKGKYMNTDYMLIKPTTFMNNSGIAVREATDAIPGFDINNMLIVYDDFQLPMGTIRIRTKGGDGGHNGISDIIYHMNTVEFPRMRNGIGNEEVLKKEDFVDYVLSDFSKEEFEKIKVMLPYYNECLENFIGNNLKTVMNKFNRNFLDAEKNGENGTIDNRLD
jgi:peptidyl-tRNA hydrolase, PTH1 family